MAQRDDLARLPADVGARARIYENGEISWPIVNAAAAINALADAGCVILGLDVRRHDEEGHTWETAWSDFSATDQYREARRQGNTAALAEEGRLHALAALARKDTAEFGDWILVSW